jgi:hypothetical protein
MRDRELFRRCQALVAQLDVPVPFDLREFCRRLQQRRGREIVLVPIVAAPSGPCGLWLALPQVDVVFHEAQTSRLHRDHIVLHEVGHMLCEHQGGPPLNESLARTLLPSLDPGVVHRVLGRTAYTRFEEREAELVASLVLERASRPAEPAPRIDPGLAEVVDRVESVFGTAARG